MTELQKAAEEYARQGRHIVPLRAGGKQPLTKNGLKNATCDLEQVRRWWKKWPNANIGWVPEPSGLIGFDVDGPEGERTARALGLYDSDTLSARSGRPDGGEHRYFLRDGLPTGVGNLKLGESGKLEVRDDAGYLVVPPSVHKSGAIYQWLNTSPAAALPEAARDAILRHLAGQSPASTNRRGKIPEGNRNNRVVSEAGILRNRGFSGSALAEKLLEFSSTHCDPPLSEAEVLGIAKRADAWDSRVLTGPELLEEFNRRFAVVLNGSVVRVLVENPDGAAPPLLLAPADFGHLIAPWKVLLPNKDGGLVPKVAYDFWMKHPRRREYDRIIFEPGKPTGAREYNLWKGFTFEPKEGPGADAFLRHLHEVVCDGDEKLTRYVLDWFAALFQYPAHKVGTALVLRGEQGTGKTLVGEAFGRLLGRHYAVVSDKEHLFGRFNFHFSDALLIQAEEAFWAGNPQHEAKLKDMITGRKQMREKKFGDAEQINSYARLLFTTNNMWAVPAAFEERRFVVVDVLDTRRNDREYFGAIWRGLEEEGGFSALLHLMLTRPVLLDTLRDVPKTRALAEQKLQSLDAEWGWWLDVLHRGWLPLDVNGTGSCPCDSVFEDYVRHTKQLNVRHRSIATKVGMFLHKAVPILRKERVRFEDGGVRYFYELPPLQDCRAAFLRKTGAELDWDDGGWLPAPFPDEDC